MALGTQILCWAPESIARAFDDLLIQWMCVDENVVRVVLQNPTGGMIKPGQIACVFILGVVKDDVVSTVTFANIPP